MSSIGYRNARSRTIKHFALIVCLLLTVVMGAASTIFAQSSCGDYECVDRSEFVTPHSDPLFDGWLPANGETYHDNVLTWLQDKSFGIWPFTTSAEGVLQVDGTKPRIFKSLYLQPGSYRMVVRVASDKQLGLFGGNTIAWRASPAGTTTTYGLGSHFVSDKFEVFVSDAFVATVPGTVTFEVSASDSPSLYYDYIWIAVDTTATATPGAGTPTATSVPASATPLPTATPYCLDASPTATPGPPQYPGTPTATPSPTPLPGYFDTHWSILDRFDFGAVGDFWFASGDGIYVSASTGRSTSNPGALFMPYSGGDYQSTTRPALILRPDQGVFTTPFYFDGWAQTNFVPQGITATVEVWLQDEAYDGGGGPAPLWYLWDTVNVSADHWYAFHQTLSGFHGGGYSGQISAVAILASRSDSGTEGGIYFDDLYVYGELGLSPFCNGTYPAITRVNTGPAGGGTDNTSPLDYPRNKPCPPDLYVPNNFWGQLLAGITLFLDRLFAFAPMHELNSLRTMASDYLISPLQFVIDLATGFFDLRVVMWAFGLILLLSGVRTMLAIWWMIKDSIPFL